MKRVIILLGFIICIGVGCGYLYHTFYEDVEQVPSQTNSTSNEDEKGPIGRIVKVNGDLYYETDREPYSGPRCGTPDGWIHSTVAEQEIPILDNQSNFGVDYAYQYGYYRNTIEVNINSKRVVFQKKEDQDMVIVRLNGQIINKHLVSSFLNKIEQGEEPNITIIQYTDEGDPIYHEVKYTCYKGDAEVYPLCHYRLIVDSTEDRYSVSPHYVYYYFKTLDTANGFVLRDGTIPVMVDGDDIIQKYIDEFIIY